MKGRALTPEDKRIVMDRFLVAWLRAPQQRLGQLVDNAVARQRRAEEPLQRPNGPDLFYIEDERLVEMVEQFTAPVEAEDGDRKQDGSKP